MPLRLPHLSQDFVATFEAESARTGAVAEAIVQRLGLDALEESPPGKSWLLSAVAVEGLPRGARLDRNFTAALAIRCWRFFIGLDNGGYVECDFRNGRIIAQRYQPPGEGRWLDCIARACLLWARQTAGDNEARLVELPWAGVQAVRAVGDDPGAVLDENWEGGERGVMLTEASFVDHVLRLAAARRQN